MRRRGFVAVATINRGRDARLTTCQRLEALLKMSHRAGLLICRRRTALPIPAARGATHRPRDSLQSSTVARLCRSAEAARKYACHLRALPCGSRRRAESLCRSRGYCRHARYLLQIHSSKCCAIA